MNGLLRLAAALVLLALLAAPAVAGHTETEHVTDEMPYTLAPGELRAGLWKLEAGLPVPSWLEGAQVGTYSWPWLLWAADARLVNAHAKAQVWAQGAWSTTLGLGLVRLGLSNDQGGDATFTVVPVEAIVGYRFGPRLTIAAGLLYTDVSLSGYYDSEDDGYLRGTATVSNLQIPITFEWRWSRRTAFIVQPRFIPYQGVGGTAHGTLRPDAYTKIEVFATGESDVADPARAFALTTDFAWSFDHLNLRAGLTFGNFSLPMLNFVSPVKFVWPNVDLYWRF